MLQKWPLYKYICLHSFNNVYENVQTKNEIHLFVAVPKHNLYDNVSCINKRSLCFHLHSLYLHYYTFIAIANNVF